MDSRGMGSFPVLVLQGYGGPWGARGGLRDRGPAITVCCTACTVGGAGATTQRRVLEREKETW